MKSSATLNPWPAFADLLFLLFVLTLAAAGVVTYWALKSEERLKGCGASHDLMVEFAKCVNTEPLDTENLCRISLGEDRLRFATNEARLDEGSIEFARLLSHCLVDSLSGRPDLFESIEFVSIDGYTDCVGETLPNLSLGASRAGTLYRYVLEDLQLRGWSDNKQKQILGKLAIRSFGKTRAPCFTTPDLHPTNDASQRRVEIAIASRLVGED